MELEFEGLQQLVASVGLEFEGVQQLVASVGLEFEGLQQLVASVKKRKHRSPDTVDTPSRYCKIPPPEAAPPIKKPETTFRTHTAEAGSRN